MSDLMSVPSLAPSGEVFLLALLPAPDDGDVVSCAQLSTAGDVAIIVPAAVVFRKSRRLSIARFIVGSLFVLQITAFE
jgi:hypothetical protein